jgi:hypothetical protein
MRRAGSDAGTLDHFYVGYKIPQIGKEFDLLRLGRESIINIELKSECTTKKIESQLLRNSYYLNFLKRKLYAFTFVSNSGDLHFLEGSGRLEVTKPKYLLEIINKQAVVVDEAIDSLFNPSDYLVSPFNSTNKFLAGEYFLTHQQEDIKCQVIKSINSTSKARFVSITGSAGTGKTLLTFDIARCLLAGGRTVLIIHCGKLNPGHLALTDQGWTIDSIRNHNHYDLARFDLVVIDEAQRISGSQLDDLVIRVRAAKCACLLSYDRFQTLSNWETSNNVAAKIDAIASESRHRLSEKIRTNKEIASFIKTLFNNKKPACAQSSQNIQINYFDNTQDARVYLSGLDKAEWEILRFTPSQYNNEHHQQYFDHLSKNSHEVIGQEFDSVAIAIDRFFVYADNGELAYGGGSYYAPTKMLFQNITRARRRLNLVIIQNKPILKRCLSVLK